MVSISWRHVSQRVDVLAEAVMSRFKSDDVEEGCGRIRDDDESAAN